MVMPAAPHTHRRRALCGAGVEQQPLLQGGQRQHVGDPVLLLQLVDLLLAQPGRRNI